MTLARAGYTPIIHCRARREQADAVREAARQLGRPARVLQFDVRDRAGAADALNADMEAHGAYYGVVLNAGLTRDGAFPALSGDDWDDVLRTNLDGFYNVMHPVVMPMIRRRAPGRIVCLTSVSGMIGNRGQVNYSASKAGLIGAAKALAVELAKRRITVNCVRARPDRHRHDRRRRPRARDPEGRSGRAHRARPTRSPPRWRSSCRRQPPTSRARCWA